MSRAGASERKCTQLIKLESKDSLDGTGTFSKEHLVWVLGNVYCVLTCKVTQTVRLA